MHPADDAAELEGFRQLLQESKAAVRAQDAKIDAAVLKHSELGRHIDELKTENNGMKREISLLERTLKLAKLT